MKSATLKWLVSTFAVLACANVSGACSKQDQRKPFTCERFQKRASRCENFLLAVLERRIRADAKTGQRTEAQAKLQRKLVKRRLLRNIRTGSPRKNCEKLARARTLEGRRRYSTMKYCYKHPSCKKFADCILQIW